MSETGTTRTASVHWTEEVFPPHHELHATPHPMVRRRVAFQLPGGIATLEQTDYGHPGRFNPWEPRGVAPALAPRTAELIGAAESIARLAG